MYEFYVSYVRGNGPEPISPILRATELYHLRIRVETLEQMSMLAISVNNLYPL